VSHRQSKLLAPSNALSFILPSFIAFSASIWLLLAALSTDMTITESPRHENDIDTSSHISLPRRYLLYIFEYSPARATYSYHVARLSVVRHSFPTFFSLPSYHSLPLPLSVRSTSTSIMGAFADPQSLLSTSFTDYGRSYYFTTFCYPSIYDRRCCYLSPSLSFYLFFLSRALPYIYLPPNMMMLYIRAPAPLPAILFY